MTYKLTIERKPTYLHAVVTGRNSQENVMRCLDEIRRECVARGCTRVLLEERLEGPRLGTMPVFEIAAKGSSRALGVIGAFAYVDVNAMDDSMKFAENVAVNRGLSVAIFSTVAAAEAWLLSLDPADSEPRAPSDRGTPHR